MSTALGLCTYGIPIGDSEPYFSSVTLLLHGDGANGSTAFIDSSSRNGAIASYGNAQISTAQSKFGGSSIYLDGTGDYLTVASANINIRTDSYTIECWFNPSATTAHSLIGEIGNDFYPLQYQGGVWYVGDGATNTISFTDTLTTGQWLHIALSFDGSTYRLFKNGNLAASSTTLLKNYNWSSYCVGARTSQSIYTNGYLDEIRVTKGVVRYTANFTPPIAPFPSS